MFVSRRYFVAYMLQYQFHEKLCSVKWEDEGITDEEIYECDIYGNMKAGTLLK